MRVALNHDVPIQAINDPFIAAKQIVELLQSDPVYGRYQGEVKAKDEDEVVVDGMPIKTTGKFQPEDIPWEESGVDLVIETTGVYRTKQEAGRHKVKKVIVAVPWVDDSDARIFIAGITEQESKSGDKVISAGSMMLNVMAPVVKEFDRKWGIEMFSATFIADPPPVEDKQLGIIAAPEHKTHGSSAEALGRIFPSLEGRAIVSKIHVRLDSGASNCTFVLKLKNPVDQDSITRLIKNKSSPKLMGWTMDHVTAADLKGARNPCTVSLRDTKMVGDSLVRLVGFYDRDFAYASRVVDLIKTHSSHW